MIGSKADKRTLLDAQSRLKTNRAAPPGFQLCSPPVEATDKTWYTLVRVPRSYRYSLERITNAASSVSSLVLHPGSSCSALKKKKYKQAPRSIQISTLGRKHQRLLLIECCWMVTCLILRLYIQFQGLRLNFNPGLGDQFEGVEINFNPHGYHKWQTTTPLQGSSDLYMTYCLDTAQANKPIESFDSIVPSTTPDNQQAKAEPGINSFSLNQ
ncbi:hypothetical protein J3F84DRAFT_237292 [Trichoderma pleuroticola]